MANPLLQAFINEIGGNVQGMTGMLGQMLGVPQSPTPPVGPRDYGFDTTGMSPQALTAFDALQNSWDQPLQVTSAYRDPQHNAAVGGAKGSQHMSGNAYDISVANMPREMQLKLIEEAKAAGFEGVGIYDGSLHFDVGPERAWGASYHADSIPDWAQPALAGNGGATVQNAGFTPPAAPSAPNGGGLKGLLGAMLGFPADPTSAQVGSQSGTSQGSTYTQGRDASQSNTNQQSGSNTQTTGSSTTRSGYDGLDPLEMEALGMSPEDIRKAKIANLWTGLGIGLGQMSHGDRVDLSQIARDFEARQQMAFQRSMEFQQELRSRAPQFSTTDSTSGTTNVSTGTTATNATGQSENSGQSATAEQSQSAGAAWDLGAYQAAMAAKAAAEYPDLKLEHKTMNDGTPYMWSPVTGQVYDLNMSPLTGYAASNDAPAIPQAPAAPFGSTPQYDPTGRLVNEGTGKNAGGPYVPPQIANPDGTYDTVNIADAFGGEYAAALRGVGNDLAARAGLEAQYPKQAAAVSYLAGLKDDVIGVLGQKGFDGKPLADQIGDLKKLLPDPTDGGIAPQVAAQMYTDFRDRLQAKYDAINAQLQATHSALTPSGKAQLQSDAAAYGHAIARVNGMLQYAAPDPTGGAGVQLPGQIATDYMKWK